MLAMKFVSLYTANACMYFGSLFKIWTIPMPSTTLHDHVMRTKQHQSDRVPDMI